MDKPCRGLIDLPAAERHGLLWVSADPAGSFDIDDLLGELGDELASWALDQSVFAWETTDQTPMNWKLAVDTFGETYHFEVLHKDTLAATVYGHCQMHDITNATTAWRYALAELTGFVSYPKATGTY